jgi:hypothetical protein
MPVLPNLSRVTDADAVFSYYYYDDCDYDYDYDYYYYYYCSTHPKSGQTSTLFCMEMWILWRRKKRDAPVF